MTDFALLREWAQSGSTATASPAAHGKPVCGKHILADLHQISADKLQHAATLEKLLRQAAQAAGAQILFSHLHSFGNEMGVTGVVLLAESHISIHTWPECGFAAADIFMCGQAEPELALAVLQAALQPQHSDIKLILRG